uniref:Tombusvirus p33 domain-containing protein n=1 Tax=Riboviria sp. TaxID=2585031 RepID=A0A514D354_9VIRU|nr:MAG: hypothetical protein H1BulkLitter533063_000001 [Riboviria sp.]
MLLEVVGIFMACGAASAGISAAAVKTHLLWKRYRESFLTPAEEQLAQTEAGLVDAHLGDAEDALVDQPDHTPAQPHRRLGRRKRNQFVAAMVAQIKNEMGCPTRTPANLLVVRKKAHDIMKERGLRPSHMSLYMETVVGLVFVPSANEIIYERMHHSMEWRRRRRLFESTIKPPTFWSWLFADDQRYWVDG